MQVNKARPVTAAEAAAVDESEDDETAGEKLLEAWEKALGSFSWFENNYCVSNSSLKFMKNIN